MTFSDGGMRDPPPGTAINSHSLPSDRKCVENRVGRSVVPRAWRADDGVHGGHQGDKIERRVPEQTARALTRDLKLTGANWDRADVLSGETVLHKQTGLSGNAKSEAMNRAVNSPRILLVEDNAINQKIIILSLKNHVKNIDIANNGKDALDKFGTSKYHLILMDIQMPVMDGILATKKIREIEASTNQHTPIIAITANALAGDKENCLAAGMNDYISKPFQPEVLINKMKNLLTT